ncbi:hypothetical protein ACGFX2_02705 [Streptomyces goshikiensis]|uniref:hypothetical protein n=1 Tax=Streptomyces goshikiensis TaxID=1942 RepID=UPI003721696A
MPDTFAPMRATRAAMFAAVCVALAAAGHSYMSGMDIPITGLLYAFGVIWALAWLAAGRRRGPYGIIASLLAAQGVLHLAFAFAGSRTPAPAAGHPHPPGPALPESAAEVPALTGTNGAAELARAHATTTPAPLRATPHAPSPSPLPTPDAAPHIPGLPGGGGVDGVPGLAGGSGVDGVPGLPGGNGVDGLHYMASPSGLPAMDGVTGMDHMAGLSGSSVHDGMAGLAGGNGLDGVHHMAGLPGTSVMDGVTGMDHMAGLSGSSVMDGMAGLAGMDGLSGLDGLTGLVAMAGHGGLGMIAAHMLAALFCAGWLAWGEAAVFRLARALGATALLAARPLARALALVRIHVAPVPPRPALRRTCERPRRLRGAVHAHAVVRRGPPGGPALRATAPGLPARA